MVSNSPFISIQKVQNRIKMLCFVIKAKKHFFSEGKKPLQLNLNHFSPIIQFSDELNNYTA